jgi:multidrug transporter EmrE-like cation transporter
MTKWQQAVQSRAIEHPWAVIGVLAAVNLVFNVVANASFRVSADSRTWRDFLFWQVVGNLAGLITVLTLTGLLRYLPLGLVFPVTTGLMVIGVQVIAAHWLFHEPISPTQWVGALLVVAGIFLIGAR